MPLGDPPRSLVPPGSESKGQALSGQSHREETAWATEPSVGLLWRVARPSEDFE